MWWVRVSHFVTYMYLSSHIRTYNVHTCICVCAGVCTHRHPLLSPSPPPTTTIRIRIRIIIAYTHGECLLLDIHGYSLKTANISEYEHEDGKECVHCTVYQFTSTHHRTVMRDVLNGKSIFSWLGEDDAGDTKCVVLGRLGNHFSSHHRTRCFSFHLCAAAAAAAVSSIYVPSMESLDTCVLYMVVFTRMCVSHDNGLYDDDRPFMYIVCLGMGWRWGWT